MDEDAVLDEREVSDSLSPASASASASTRPAASLSSATASSLAAASSSITSALSSSTFAFSKLAKGGRKLFSGAKATAPNDAAGASAVNFTSGTAPPAPTQVVDLMNESPSGSTNPSLQDGSQAQENQDDQDEALLREISAKQRAQMLEDLVTCRRSDFSYLREIHSESHFWFNVAFVRERDVELAIGDKHLVKRTQLFFYLGLALGKLVETYGSGKAQGFVLACCELLEELEFFFSSQRTQNMKLMVMTSSALYKPIKKDEPQADEDLDQESTELTEPFRPVMKKWHQRPIYRRLVTTPIPFAFDYREILISLCDILAIAYSKLVEDTKTSDNVFLFQTVLKLDERIKKLVIEPIRKEFTSMAMSIVQEEMTQVRKKYTNSYAAAPSNATTVPSPPSQ